MVIKDQLVNNKSSSAVVNYSGLNNQLTNLSIETGSEQGKPTRLSNS